MPGSHVQVSAACPRNANRGERCRGSLVSMRLGCQEHDLYNEPYVGRSKQEMQVGAGEHGSVSSIHPELGLIVSRDISPPRSSISPRPFSSASRRHKHKPCNRLRTRQPDNSLPTDSYPHPCPPGLHAGGALLGDCHQGQYSPFRNLSRVQYIIEFSHRK
jgi:hypothetical protein